MKEKYSDAGRGLKRMFNGQILALLGAVVTFVGAFMLLGGTVALSGATAGIGALVGIVGGIAALVGSILCLVGLLSARNADSGYMSSIYALIANVVLTFALRLFAQGSAVYALVSALQVAVAFLQVYFICIATTKLLRECGDEDVARKGDTVWKISAAGAGITIAGTLLGIFVAALGGIMGVVGTVVALVGSVLYLIFLHGSSKSLLAQQ